MTEIISHPQDDLWLNEEVIYLYKNIFKKHPCQTIIKEYVRANRKLLPPAETNSLKHIIAQKADFEAIELAWRFKNANNPLTKKIHILMYIAETSPENYEIFLNTKNKQIISLGYLSLYFFIH